MSLAKACAHSLRVLRRIADCAGPSVLFRCGVAGGVTACILSARAGWVARGRSDDVDREYMRASRRDIFLEKARRIVPVAAPAALTAAGSVAALVAGRHLDMGHQRTLAAAYTALSDTMAVYQRKVAERLGEDEHRHILEDVAEDGVAKSMPASYEDEAASGIKPQGHGSTLCYDRVTGRYFYTEPERIREAEAEMARRCFDQLTVSVNDFYEELGVPDYSYVGSAIGWDDRCLPDIVFRSMLDEDDRPCLVLMYSTVVLSPGDLRRCW